MSEAITRISEYFASYHFDKTTRQDFWKIAKGEIKVCTHALLILVKSMENSMYALERSLEQGSFIMGANKKVEVN